MSVFEEELDSTTAGPPAGLASHRVDTPTVLQMEAVECGAAALAMVLAHHGMWKPLEDLRSECGVSRDGSRAANVLRAARANGMDAKGMRIEPENLGDVPLPAILFWNFNHFVVLEGYGPKGVFLNDPSSGQRQVSWGEFDGSFTGIVLQMTTNESFVKGGSPPSVVAGLAARFDRAKTAIAFCLLAGLGLLVPGLLIPGGVQIFVNQYLGAGNRSWLWLLVFGVAAASLVQIAFTWLQQMTLLRLSTRLSMSMSTRFVEHILRLPLVFFGQRYTGNVVNRISLNDQVANLLSSQLATTSLGMITASFYLVLMSIWDWQLTIVAVVFASGNFITISASARGQKTANAHAIQETGKLTATAAVGLVNIEAMKASSEDASFFSRWAGQQANVVTTTQQIAFNNSVSNGFPPALSALNTAVLLGFGGWQVMTGHLSIGTLTAFQMLVGGFNGPIGQLVGFAQTIRQAAGNLSNIDDVMGYPQDPEMSDPTKDIAAAGDRTSQPSAVHDGALDQPADRSSGLQDPLPARLSGAIELTDVTFGYSPLDPPLITNFSMKVLPGQRIAVVGKTGSGKSTVAKIVAGLNRAWTGQVQFDGVPREQIPRDVMAATLAMVDQDIRLFEGTVRDNITLWDSTIPEESVVSAARDAGIHDDIVKRPAGYDRLILEGGNDWSGGQRQRLEIARALAGNPSILVLDEATAALDPLVEVHIDQALRQRGITCVIIAHRLSTIRDCDEIIVLEAGNVAERGQHSELIALGGIYASLVGE